MVKALGLKDVATVFELYKSSVWVFLKAKKDLGEFLTVTNKALVWARLSAQSNTRMTTAQQLSTWYIAARPIAWFRAKIGTPVVLALPLTWLGTWKTAHSTFLFTPAVDTVVLTLQLTGRAFCSTRLLTLVGADQEALARAVTWLMKSSFKAGMTGTCTHMSTLQCDRTLSRTFHRLLVFHLLSDPALKLLVVATFQHDCNQFRTLLSAFLPTEFVACMPAVQLFLARFLAKKLTVWSKAWHHLQVATLRNSFLY